MKYLPTIFVIVLFSCKNKQEKSKQKELGYDDHFKMYNIDTSKMLKENQLSDYLKNTPSNIIPSTIINQAFDSAFMFDKIIAYDYKGDEEVFDKIIENRKFSLVIEKQKQVSQKQAESLFTALAKNKSFGGWCGGCFIPHFALLFYHNNVLVNEINVCLGCNQIGSDIGLKAKTSKSPCLSPYAENAIIKLCKELGFYYGK